MANDPVLAQFDGLKIVYGNTFQEMKAEKENEGQDAWQNLRSDLMKHFRKPAAGAILHHAAIPTVFTYRTTC